MNLMQDALHIVSQTYYLEAIFTLNLIEEQHVATIQLDLQATSRANHHIL